MEAGAATRSRAAGCEVASPAGSCGGTRDVRTVRPMRRYPAEQHGWAARAGGFWRLHVSLSLIGVLRVLGEPAVLPSWLGPAASSDAGGRARPQGVLLSAQELAGAFPPPLPRGRAAQRPLATASHPVPLLSLQMRWLPPSEAGSQGWKSRQFC